MADRFWLTRVPFPGRLLNDGDGDECYRYEETGGQWEWCWAVPLPYQALVAPTVARGMPAAPDGRGYHNDFLSYWSSLQSFLTFSFGWARHDKGLMSWFDAGCPTDDPRLALIEQVWGRDGALERYLEWCLVRPGDPGPLDRWRATPDSSPLEMTTAWRRRLSEARQASTNTLSGISPYGQHLERGEHISGPAWSSDGDSEPELPRRLSVTDRSRREATLHCDSVRGWYAQLAAAYERLPHSPDRSWRVDVYVRPVGFMGTFRRSRTTGLYFAGQHRWHSAGN